MGNMHIKLMMLVETSARTHEVRPHGEGLIPFLKTSLKERRRDIIEKFTPLLFILNLTLPSLSVF